MIETLRLKNFRSHAETTVELGRLTVLVGANGSGKSSVLEALGLLSRLSGASALDIFRGDSHPRYLTRFGAGELAVSASGTDVYGAIEAQRTGDDWRAYARSHSAVGTEGNFDATAGRSATGKLADDAFPSVQYVRLDRSKLAGSAPMKTGAQMGEDGSDLAAVLANLRLADSELFDAIVHDLKAIVPQVQGLRINTVQGPAFQVALDISGARALPAHSLSEGTLIALGLVTALRTRHTDMLLIDDIDHALHPKAQWEVIALLRRMLDANPALQIVATTHSPYFVDELAPHEVRVCALDIDGITHCRSLAEHPQAKEFEGVLSTGEFLGVEDFSWVTEARSA